MTKQRPTSITVYGILNLVFSGLWLVCISCGAVAEPLLESLPAQQGQSGGIDQKAMHKYMADNVPGYEVFRWSSLGLSGALGLLLLLCGILLLRMSPLARPLSIAWCVLAIIYVLMAMVYGLLLANPAQIEYLKQHPTQFDFGPAFYTVVSLVSAVLLLIYPTILLIFMLKSSTAKALAGTNAEVGPSEDYYDSDFERRRRDLPPPT